MQQWQARMHGYFAGQKESKKLGRRRMRGGPHTSVLPGARPIGTCEFILRRQRGKKPDQVCRLARSVAVIQPGHTPPGWSAAVTAAGAARRVRRRPSKKASTTTCGTNATERQTNMSMGG
jgi:hypothetical protein